MPRQRKLRPIPGRPNEFVDVASVTPAQLVEAFKVLGVRDRWLVLKELNKLPVMKTERPMMSFRSSAPLRGVDTIQGELDASFAGQGRLRGEQ